MRTRLINDIDKLAIRRSHLFKTYTSVFTASLGVEVTEEIVKKLKQRIGEHEEHIDADFESIKGFLSVYKNPEETGGGDVVLPVEVTDDSKYKYSPQAVKRLEGHNMSIRIGSRSHHDLYLGNYSACCIRIDSNHHGSESPIADYVTDIGMQNVIIYDDDLHQPVACAWCWIGVDKRTAKPFLVVDNVEGWQHYTVNFRTQLEAKLHEYLSEYAKVIGVDLTQGPDYNDLNVLPPKNQHEHCVKLGGYNRRDGYYLEAELPDIEWNKGIQEALEEKRINMLMKNYHQDRSPLEGPLRAALRSAHTKIITLVSSSQ